MMSHNAVRKVGMDFDDATNGIMLPRYGQTLSELPVDRAFPLHRGNHRGYSHAMKELLDDINLGMSNRKIEAEIFNIQTAAQRSLIEGGVNLFPAGNATKEMWLQQIRRFL